ncbi:hypothetical protein [Mangrovicoccus ximenensis]|uniref:hypothetical protein n=1 Tax=Mangrovicoccus ximenensis TaxID=1911570 RepID=UPI0038B3C2E7
MIEGNGGAQTVCGLADDDLIAARLKSGAGAAATRSSPTAAVTWWPAIPAMATTF